MSSLLDVVARRAAERGQDVAIRTALKSGWTERSWAELHDGIRRVAGGARDLPSDRPVAVALDNSADSIAVLLGLLQAGRSVICVESSSSHLQDPRSTLLRVAATTVAPTSAAGIAYADLLAGPRAAPAPGAPAQVCQLTSGSTGEPRIVRHPIASIDRGAEIYRNLFRYGRGDEVLLPIPAAHSFGLVGGLAAGLLAGARVALLGAFSLRRVHEALAGDATIMLGTPLVYRLLASGPVPVVSRLRFALSSGGPLSSETKQAAEAMLGVRVGQIYGSTETGIIAYPIVEGPALPPGATGIAAPGVSWRIDDRALFVRTSTTFTGYLEAEGTVEFDPAAEYPTGDLARLDGDVLTLIGRKNSFINVGGRKVNPDHVARVLGDYDGVSDVHVFGLEGPAGEQEVHAAVVARDVAPADLTRYCRTRLAPHEVPRLHILSRLPRSALGKVDLSQLLAALPTAGPDREESRTA